MGVRPFVVVTLAAGVLLATAPVRLAGLELRPFDVARALALYDQGDYATFDIDLAQADRLEDSFEEFRRTAASWIGASEIDALPRRRLVAATVALEVAHRLRAEPADRAGHYLAWAVRLMREKQAVEPAVERRWYLAALTGSQELDRPWDLAIGRGASGYHTHNARLRRLAESLGRGGLLAIAAGRFPDEPRFRLGQVQAEESEATFQAGSPAHLAFIGSQAAAGVHENHPSGVAQYAVGVRNQAVELLARRARIPGILDAYSALSVHESVRAEAALHMGYLEGLQMNWTAARAHLRRVEDWTHEPFLLYLASVLRGQMLQAQGDRPAAKAAFEKAEGTVPGARSALTLLAYELMLDGSGDSWTHAEALLRRAHAPEAPSDPWRLFGHGQARLRSDYATALRESLSRR